MITEALVVQKLPHDPHVHTQPQDHAELAFQILLLLQCTSISVRSLYGDNSVSITERSTGTTTATFIAAMVNFSSTAAIYV